MASFEIVWKSSALRDIRSLPREVVASCLGKISSLKSNPMPAGIRKIRGTEHTYRLRMGRYRIIYQIDGTRMDVYRALPPASP
jgi:mRNA interferase RelE/StbE